MFGASCDADHAAAVQPHQPGPAGAAWPGDDAGHLTLERAGRQLPHRAALFQHGGGWSQVHWLLIQTHLRQPQATYLRVGDAVVVTQAGAERHGLERFFSSLFGKPVPGLAFFAFALVNVQQRTAHPLRRGQILRPERAAEPVAVAPAAPVAKRGRGRPEGSQNRNQAAVALVPYLSFSLTLLQAVRQVLSTTLVVTYVVLDGAFGNHYALRLVRRCQYDLISKLASIQRCSSCTMASTADVGPTSSTAQRSTMPNCQRVISSRPPPSKASAPRSTSAAPCTSCLPRRSTS